MPSASLWAAVPHYVAVAPNPKGALALLRKLEGLVGVTVDATELETAAVEYERQVTRAVELDPDVQAFVERLERAADEEEEPTRPLPAPVRRRARARVPALPAPARRRPPRYCSCRLSCLRRRAGDPVVAHRARRVARRRLEALAEDAVGDLEHRVGDPVAVLLGARHRHLRVVEHVVVGLLGRLELPRLARADRVQRELHVVAQLGGASSGGRSCSRSARSRRRAAGRRGRRGRAAGAGPIRNGNERSNHTGSASSSRKRSW